MQKNLGARASVRGAPVLGKNGGRVSGVSRCAAVSVRAEKVGLSGRGCVPHQPLARSCRTSPQLHAFEPTWQAASDECMCTLCRVSFA